jgi:hypothetical protein
MSDKIQSAQASPSTFFSIVKDTVQRTADSIALIYTTCLRFITAKDPVSLLAARVCCFLLYCCYHCCRPGAEAAACHPAKSAPWAPFLREGW